VPAERLGHSCSCATAASWVPSARW